MHRRNVDADVLSVDTMPYVALRIILLASTELVPKRHDRVSVGEIDSATMEHRKSSSVLDTTILPQ